MGRPTLGRSRRTSGAGRQKVVPHIKVFSNVAAEQAGPLVPAGPTGHNMVSVRKGTACRTRRSTAARDAWPAGTLSRKTSPLNSPVTGGPNRCAAGIGELIGHASTRAAAKHVLALGHPRVLSIALVAAAGGDENRGREREYQLGQGQTAEPGGDVEGEDHAADT